MAEARAGWSVDVEGGCRSKRMRSDSCEAVHLWEVSAKINELEPLSVSVEELQAKVAVLTGKLAANALCQERELDALALEDGQVGEFQDLVAEAKLDVALNFTLENLEKLRVRGQGAHILNKFTAMAHAVDLERLVVSDPSSWMTSCGWKFCCADVLVKAGAPTRGRCTKKGCSLRFSELAEDSETESSEDGEGRDDAPGVEG